MPTETMSSLEKDHPPHSFGFAAEKGTVTGVWSVEAGFWRLGLSE